MKALLREIFDDEGNLIKIVATSHDSEEHIFDALWSPYDAQTPANREKFRQWVITMLRRGGHEPIN